MERLLDFSMGPLFRFSLAVTLLGALRAIALTLYDMHAGMRRAADKTVPWKSALRDTLSWTIPLGKLTGTRPVLSMASFVFHTGLLLVAVFLQDHILLWRKATGLSWFSLPRVLADALTLAAILACGALLMFRIIDKAARTLSGFQDYALLLLLCTVLLSGYFASRPINPLTHRETMLIHTLCANTILMLLPFTKLVHSILYPLLWIATAVAWRFPSLMRVGDNDRERR